MKAENARSTAGPEQHQLLVLEIARTLSFAIPASEIDRLAFTSSFWQIQGNAMFSPTLLDYEFEQIARRLKAATDELEQELERWEYAGNVVVPDTNVFLHVLERPIAATDWHRLAECPSASSLNVVLVITVLDELDRAKLTNDRTAARRTLKEINDLSAGGMRATIGPGLNVEIVVPEVGHRPLPIADNEIIDQTLQLGTRIGRGFNSMILTADTGMAMRARAVGQRVKLLEQAPK
jgi:hypothetical protein